MNYSALDRYIQNVRDKPFKWGDHDCLTFANSACVATVGYGFADDLPKYKTAAQCLRIQYKYLQVGGISFLEEMDRRRDRQSTIYPPRGFIVARPQESDFFGGHILGVCVGRLVAFVCAEDGLSFHAPETGDMVWSPLK